MSVDHSTAGETDRPDDLIDAQTSPPDERFEDAYGLTEQREKLERTVLDPLAAGAPLDDLQTICIGGKPGTGKTWLARALAGELDAFEFSFYDVTEDFEEEEFRAYVTALIEAARETEPSLILFEHGRFTYETAGDLLREQLGALHGTGAQILTIATIPNAATDPRRRRNVLARFRPDMYLEVDEPSTERRTAMLRDRLCSRDGAGTFDVDRETIDVADLAAQLSWATPADIEFVCQRLDHLAYGRDEPFSQADIKAVVADVTREREQAVPGATEAASNGVESESDGPIDRLLVAETDVAYDDIGGLDGVIDRLTDLLVVPSEYPELFEQSNLQKTQGVLLYGPPGNGKTLLARALATETDRTFLSVRGPELKNKWFGESERRIRDLFDTADAEAPSIVFFDEFDAVAGARNACSSSPTTSMVNMLLSEMGGLDERGDVLFLAATNRIDALDDAVLRPGRIGATIEITPPDAAGRAEIFEIYAADLPTADSVTPEWFAEVSPDGLSGAQIEAVCRQALHTAVRNSDAHPTIRQVHVQRHLDRT